MQYLLRRPAVWPGMMFLFMGLVCFGISQLTTPRYVQQLRAAGLPASLMDLKAGYPNVPENAATLYAQAASLHVRLGRDVALHALGAGIRPGQPLHYPPELLLAAPILGNGTLPETAQALPEAYVEMFNTYLLPNGPALDKMREATSGKSVYFPVDLGAASSGTHEHLTLLDELSKLVRVNTLMKARAGDAAGATDSLLCELRLPGALENEPILASQMTRSSLTGTAVNSLQLVVRSVALTDAQLASIQEVLDLRSWSSTKPLERAFQGQQAGLLAMIGLIDTLGDGPGWSAGASARLSKTLLGLGAYDPWVTVHFFDRLARDIQGPDPYVREMPEGLESELPAFRMLVSHGALTGLSRVKAGVGAMAAHVAVAQAGLAVQRYCLAEGHAPETLDQLVPRFLAAVPKDPFLGVPVRYARLRDDILVYSVGRDRMDNSGNEQVEPSGMAPSIRGRRGIGSKPDAWGGDITFTVSGRCGEAVR